MCDGAAHTHAIFEHQVRAAGEGFDVGDQFLAAETVKAAKDPGGLGERHVADEEDGAGFGEKAQHGALLCVIVASDEADDDIGLEGDHLAGRCLR